MTAARTVILGGAGRLPAGYSTTSAQQTRPPDPQESTPCFPGDLFQVKRKLSIPLVAHAPDGFDILPPSDGLQLRTDLADMLSHCGAVSFGIAVPYGLV